MLNICWSDDSHEMSNYFLRNKKMYFKLSSTAAVIGPLRLECSLYNFLSDLGIKTLLFVYVTYMVPYKGIFTKYFFIYDVSIHSNEYPHAQHMFL